MSTANFARFLFAYTIGSHIILVSASIGLILLVTILEVLQLRKHSERYATLLYRLKKLFVISFGVGTASGIVMAVELVNLFPPFMTLVSETGVIAVFYAEIFTFFLETIALVLYAYYDDVFKWKYSNLTLSIFILIGTLLSAVFITMVNAWMNTPNGFNINTYISTGTVTGVNPWAPFATPSTLAEVAHVLTTTVLAGMLIFGAFFGIKYFRTSDKNERALAATVLRIVGVVSIIDIILVGLTGSHEMATLLVHQPLKYAALELDYSPGSNAERLFGTIVNGQYVGGIPLPGIQKLLAGLEGGGITLPGLSQFSQSNWPPLLVHSTFDIMVLGGLLMGLFFFIMFLMFVTKRDPMKYRFMLFFQIIVGILGFIVYELGWVTAEVGRSPWIVYNVLKIKNAINTSTGIIAPGWFIVAMYLVVVPATFYFFARVYSHKGPAKEEGSESPVGGANY